MLLDSFLQWSKYMPWSFYTLNLVLLIQGQTNKSGFSPLVTTSWSKIFLTQVQLWPWSLWHGASYLRGIQATYFSPPLWLRSDSWEAESETGLLCREVKQGCCCIGNRTWARACRKLGSKLCCRVCPTGSKEPDFCTPAPVRHHLRVALALLRGRGKFVISSYPKAHLQ